MLTQLFVVCSFFLEKNILGYILKILNQPTNNRVKVQLLQTLSILLENISNQNSLCTSVKSRDAVIFFERIAMC
jgi:hypothetical protein